MMIRRSGTAIVVAGTLAVAGCASEDTAPSDAPPTTVAVSIPPATSTAPAPEPPEEPEAATTINDYLGEQGIGRTPLPPGSGTGPIVEFDVPEGWEPADPATYPQAHFVALGTEWFYEADPGPLPTAVLTVQRLDRVVPAEELLEHADGALRNLPEFEIALDDEDTVVGGFPSYAVSGEFRDSEHGYMAVVERTVVADIDDTTYVVQLRVSSLSRDAEAIAPTVQEIDGSLRIEPRAPEEPGAPAEVPQDGGVDETVDEGE
ncbi:LpqN/LpqT family lipoprotein [Hoyosella sp. G463]|uniref:LpqN/LpqT family lipoprotein n=1 Tax=Lolliginicoccus lacisalsi TaxID=2742202 RepID=A0A927JBB3_9ACTN|nr:LpqN/LpqT family lipoprotein [Lolliginicoccus lacisalsi]MBD8506039.1 LpqN/LpqT family lipoprotein [Lolliginicoccus lacisalsi]